MAWKNCDKNIKKNLNSFVNKLKLLFDSYLLDFTTKRITNSSFTDLNFINLPNTAHISIPKK